MFEKNKGQIGYPLFLIKEHQNFQDIPMQNYEKSTGYGYAKIMMSHIKHSEYCVLHRFTMVLSVSFIGVLFISFSVVHSAVK